MASMLQKVPAIVPVIGATNIPHVEGAVEALSVKLPVEEMAYMEKPYAIHPIVGPIPYGGQWP